MGAGNVRLKCLVSEIAVFVVGHGDRQIQILIRAPHHMTARNRLLVRLLEIYPIDVTTKRGDHLDEMR